MEQLEPRQLLSAAIRISEGWFNGQTQLQITGSHKRDRISVVKQGRAYTITAQAGFRAVYHGKYKSLVINSGRGNDRVVLSSSITIPSEISGGAGKDVIAGGSGSDTIYGNSGRDKIYGEAGDDTIMCAGGTNSDYMSGGAGADTFWADASSSEQVADLSRAEAQRGALHRIGSFLATPASQVGAATVFSSTLIDPATTESSITYDNYADHPLFGKNGPTADDVAQGYLGDCYFLASLSAVAKVDPMEIRQTVADLGDGTYAVNFHRDAKDVYVRVTADLPSWSEGNLAYANFGSDGSMWVAVVEKAFALFRGGTASYGSIDSGWMTEAFSALGLDSSSVFNTRSLTQQIDQFLSQGKAVTYATGDVPSGSGLIGDHAYSVDHVVRDRRGDVTAVVLRNPWGVDGAGSDGVNDGYVTIATPDLLAAFSGVVVGEA
jgi:hypothetical protein